MPVNPFLEAGLRRNWQLLGAALVLFVLLVLHMLVFVPTERRYSRAIRDLGGADAALDPWLGPAPLPPRVHALVAENAMADAELARRTASGQLAVMMLEDLSAMASRAGLKVTLSEPGPITPQPTRVEARVHLRVRGDYRQLVTFIAAMEASGRLYDLERYEVSGPGPGELQMDLWIARLFLKHEESRK